MPELRRKLAELLWHRQDPLELVQIPDEAVDMQGWRSYHRYFAEAVARIRPSIVLEIGVWKGASAIHIASLLRELEIDGVVVAVDTWLGSWEHWSNRDYFDSMFDANAQPRLFTTFINNVRHSGLTDFIVPLPLDSSNAAQVLARLDIKAEIIHLDGAHDYDAVVADLKRWWRRLQPGGILIGDDYREGNEWPDVKRAFDDFFRPLGLTPIENIDDKCRVIKSPAAESLKQSATVNQEQLDNIAQAVSAWREKWRLECVRLLEDSSLAASDLIDAYIRFQGPYWWELRFRLQNRIVDALNSVGKACSRDRLFGSSGEIRTQVLRDLGVEFDGRYPDASPLVLSSSWELLPPGENRFAPTALPAPINKNMSRPRRPPLMLYRYDGADLFLTPLGYELFNEGRSIFWPDASTQAYSDRAVSVEHKRIDQPVVLIQDVFEGQNFCHFLFDWVPRLVHFLMADVELREACLFVMGGAPGEFQAAVLQRLGDLYGLQPQQFVFPASPEIWQLRAGIYFFSDLKTNMHPAHMVHEKSVAAIRQIASGIAGRPARHRRIYISRADTTFRKVANEPELWPEIRRLGFVMVFFAGIPVRDQLALVRGAEVIVAPHGMGLTHIAFHEGKPVVIELHNPTIGTDAYAFISHALEFPYRAVFGEPVKSDHGDYIVSPSDLVSVLAAAGVTEAPPDGVTMELRAQWFGGVQSRAADMAKNVPLPTSVSAAYRHIRDDPARQPDNNVGWLAATGMEPGLVFHCRCEVWIPSNFHGDAVAMQCAELMQETHSFADLKRRDQWQTVGIVGSVMTGGKANFVLRQSGIAGDVIFSCQWRVGLGPF